MNNPPFIAAPEEEELGLIDFQAVLARYTLSEIEMAMNGLERRIGSGGSADIYYRKLADGTEVTDKCLNSS